MRVISLLLCLSLIACEGKKDTKMVSELDEVKARLAQETKTSQRLQRYIDHHLGGVPKESVTPLDSLQLAFIDSALVSSLNELIAGLGKTAQVEIRSKKSYLLRLGDDLLFASGKYTLNKKGVETVIKVGTVLEHYPLLKIDVLGHTDDRPVAKDGLLRDNWDLSVMRANAVIRGLIEEGVSPTQIRAIGHGPYNPIDLNDREAGRYLNRRTEILLYRE